MVKTEQNLRGFLDLQVSTQSNGGYHLAGHKELVHTITSRTATATKMTKKVYNYKVFYYHFYHTNDMRVK